MSNERQMEERGADRRDAVIAWLARELAQWELATDGVIITPAILEDHARRCVEAALRATGTSAHADGRQ